MMTACLALEHLPLESIIAGKKILCEFVTEIRHAVIVTKRVISQASVIRGARPRHKHYPVTPNFVPIFLSFQYYIQSIQSIHPSQPSSLH